MGFFDLFSKKQREANQTFLAEQRNQQAISKIKKLAIPYNIKQQLITAGVFDLWFNVRDLTPLIELLEKSDEIITYTATGINDQSETSLLIATNRNLIIISKKHANEIVKTIPLEQIKSVLVKTQIVYDDITFVVNNDQLSFNSLNKMSASILADTIRKQLKPDDLDKQMEQIKKLKELADQGVLTEEEFQAKKKQILNI